MAAKSPPSKHRVQQSGNLHSISGSEPPQSENNTISKSQIDSGIVPVRKLNCNSLCAQSVSRMLRPRSENRLRVEWHHSERHYVYGTYSSVRLPNCPSIMSGTVPVNALPSKNKSRSSVALENSCGIVPVNVLLDK